MDQIRRTPGLEEASLGKGCVEFTDGKAIPVRGSAVIRCGWPVMRDHVAGWLYASQAKPKVLITSTAELRGAYLDGSIHRVLSGPDLVVVRLLDTHTGWKMLPDIVIESIALARTIWLVHELGSAFGKGHPCWGPAVEEATKSFARRDLGPPPDPDSTLAKLGIGGAK